MTKIVRCLEDERGATAVELTNGGPYPHALICGAFEATATGLGADDVEVKPTRDPKAFHISWSIAEEP